MKIFVLNGSPKGSTSISLYTIKFLQCRFPEYEFKVFNVAQKLRYYSQNPHELRVLEEADVILWSYPVYTFLAPAQLHRIIELMKEEGVCLEGKWCSQFTTSKHVYDFTAHRFIEDNAADMGMKIITGLSADMDDLLTERGQEVAVKWWNSVLFAMDNGVEMPRAMCGLKPSEASAAIDLPIGEMGYKTEQFDTLIVTCDARKGSNLWQMIEYFKRVYPSQVRVIDLAEYKFQGGCIGCLRCTSSGKCFYGDGFDTFLRGKVQNADAIIYAYDLKDHSMGSVFKMFNDRQFCNGHRTMTMGKPIGYIVSGKLSVEENVKTYMNAVAQVGHNQLAYIASDEFDAKNDIENLAQQTLYALENKLLLPLNFYGIGGHKIFRDLIYEMRGMMPADHKFYKEKGFYNDFPQRRWKRSLFMKLVGLMMKNKKMNAQVQRGIVMPYEKLIERCRLVDR